MTINKKFILPFKIKSDSPVTGGYVDQLHSQFASGTQITNYHEDQYRVGETELNIPTAVLQSPFTEQWVGGRSHRHVPLNTGSDSSATRPEAWHLQFSPNTVRLYSHKYRESPPAYWVREEHTKRPVNIKNQGNSGLYLGNFSKNYEVVQSSGRRITNNLVVDDLTASSGLTTLFVTGANNFSLPDLTIKQQSVIVERFNAPGSKEESSRGILDREGEEMSPNIPLPFRNIKVRQPYYRQLAQHMPQFGSGSTYAALPATGSVNTVSIHKNNRNRLVRAGKEYFDNWFITHALPRTDIQYSWITASATTTAAQLGGYQSYQIAGATGSTYNRAEAYTDIAFNLSRSYGDNYGLSSNIKDLKSIDTGSNTFLVASASISASFSEITNTNYTFTTWTSLRGGEHPVARALKKNNIVSVLDAGRPSTYKTLAGRLQTVYPRRGNTVSNYVDPPVTFKYYPLVHTVSLTSDGTEKYDIVHEYTNTLSTFANKELNIKLGISEDGERFYNFLKEKLATPETSGLYYIGHRYRETIWPREEVTGLEETRTRVKYILDQPGTGSDGYDRQLGTQRVFWRDNQTDRKRSKLSDGGYFSSIGFLSTEESGSNFTQNEIGVLSDNKPIVFEASYVQNADIDSGLFNSILLLEEISAERELFAYSASVTSEFFLGSSQVKQRYGDVNKRGYVFDISGEWNNTYIDFYEQVRSTRDSYKRSIGSLYRGTSYRSLLTGLPENRDTYSDAALQTEDEQVFANPKLRYVPFIGGGELNTGSFVQDSSNFTNEYRLFQGIQDGEVSVISADGASIYVGGIFTKIDALEVNYIAEWNTLTNTWSALDSGLNSTALAIAVSGSDIYVGGSFITPASRIVKWDTITNTWSALDSGVDQIVRAIAVSGSDIYVGGNFNTPASKIAKWNGSTWSALGSGVDGTVNAIAVSGSDIYVGGLFTTASGTPANYIAKWNGSSWSALGSGVTSSLGGIVNAIAVSGSDVYVGGFFSTASGTPASNIAKWDTATNTWSALGSGLDSTALAIAVSGSDIYVGGLFTTASGTPANYIAKWDTATNTWSALGSGLNGIVNSIAVSGSDIYVGGSFTTPASKIAKWNTLTETFEPVLTQLNYDVFSSQYHDQTFANQDFLLSTIDCGLVKTNENGKKRAFDSYEKYQDATKSVLKKYSILPEFKISENIKKYIQERGGNFRSINSDIVKIDGTGTSKLFKTLSSTDVLKKADRIAQQNNESTLQEIQINISGFKKLLPYNGFYPQERTVQLANLYAEYADNNLHGGYYNLNYKNDYLYDIAVQTTNALSASSISVCKYGEKYYMAVGYPSLATDGAVPIYVSNNAESWSSTFTAISLPGGGDAGTDFGQKVYLLSASNGLNLFINSRNWDSSSLGDDTGYILLSTSTNGSSWTTPQRLQVDGTSVFISGSSNNSEFGTYFDLVYDNSNSQEKIVMLIGSRDADPSAADAGEAFIVTASLQGGAWKWSEKLQILTGSAADNRMGVGTSIISCSSGYQAFVGEQLGDQGGFSPGNIWVCTSSDGTSWSTPVTICRGSQFSSFPGRNNIKAVDFKNRTYVFFSEPQYSGPQASFPFAGQVVCISSSANNAWPTINSFLPKRQLYTTNFSFDHVLNQNYSYSIEVFSGSDGRLYYGFVNAGDNGLCELFTGYTDGENYWQTSENAEAIIIQEPPGTLGFNTIAVAPLDVGGFSLPIFFTDLQSGSYYNIQALKNNIFTEFVLKVSGSEKYYQHAALEPFFAPGILYNTIKSGIAVDWPCATGSQTSIAPYGANTIVNAYYPKPFEMARYDGPNIIQTMYGHLRSNIDYRIPFENLLFPNEAFISKDFLQQDLERTTVLSSLPENDPLVSFIDQTYIYGGYEPYISPLDFSDINDLGPKRFSVPFVYRKKGSQDTGLFSLAMSNFLAETVKFFLKDEKLTTFTSQPDYRWREFNSDKTYYMDIVLEKTPDLVMMEAYHSELHPTGANGEKMNGRYFGYPVNKTDKPIWGEQEFTAEERRLIHNDPAYAPYTPPYLEGEARVRIAFKPTGADRKYTLQEIFDKSTVENIFVDVARGATIGSDAYRNKMPVGSSIELFGAAQAVEVTIDEVTGRQSVRELPDSQNWIISTRMETPVLDFSSQSLTPYENNYSKTGGFGRGMWSGYGEIPTDGKGIKIRLEYPFITSNSPLTASLLEQVGLRAEERNVGEIAESKTISEAVVVIPYLEQPVAGLTYEYSEGGEDKFYFIKIDKTEYRKQLGNIKRGQPAVSAELPSTSISEMIEKMERYIVPPNMNFLQYSDIHPFVMYIAEFEHTLSQQDLADIWQSVMPEISKVAQEDSVTVSHPTGQHEFFGGADLPEDLRWLVFKIKRKAEYNYFNVTANTRDDSRFDFNKIIGRKRGTDIYSYNWPYDFFSLVEYAKVDIQLDYKKKEDEE